MFSNTHNLFTEIRSPLDQFEVRDILNLEVLGGNLHLSITNIGLYLRASARLLLELITTIHGNSDHEEYVANPVGGNNPMSRKAKGTIACYIKWVIEGAIDYLNQISRESTLTHVFTMVDTELWNARFFWCRSTAVYKESISRLSWNSLSSIKCEQVKLLFHNYSSLWGQECESATIVNEGPRAPAVSKGIGEIHRAGLLRLNSMEVRGFIVMSNMKESKSRLRLSNRAYTTRNQETNSLLSKTREDQNADLGFEKLAKLWHFNYLNPNKIFKENFKTILNTKELWYASYIKVRTSKGSNTPGIDLQTLDRTTQEKLDRLREQVMARKYEWSPVKRVEIPKGNGKTRPLGIPTLNDRVVQEVLRSILEAIFEPIFNGNSHGFRPGRSCHTALKQVHTRFKGGSWYIEGDIKSYFDSINHNILINLLRRKVRDNLILDLVESALNADVIFNNKIIEHVSGTPQGGILSPLLSNIYLHEFDQHMEEIMKKYQGTREKPKVNREYLKYMDKRRKGWNPTMARKVPAMYPFDKEYTNVKYVRYADDFLIGITGSREMAADIRDKIKAFLETRLALTLNIEKTHITHTSKIVPFLGYLIGRRTILTMQKYRGKLVNRKMTIPTLDANVQKMVESLTKTGFCNKAGEARTNFTLLMLPQSEINQRINSIIRGISYWWSLAGNRRRAVARISYILRFSAAKLYAAKFKLGSLAKVFAVGGIGLNKPLSSNKKSVVGVTDERVEKWLDSNSKDSNMNDKSRKKSKRIIAPILYEKYKDIPGPTKNKLTKDWEPDFVKSLNNPESLNKIIKMMKNNEIRSTDSNPISLLGWRMNKGIKVLEECCIVCGTDVGVEMHHVKSLGKLKPLKDSIKDKQRAIMRKQIPLCRNHHFQIHNNNWRNIPISIDKFLNDMEEE